MEKRRPSSPDLQCVGTLEIAKPKPVGFLCGSIPVITDKEYYDFTSAAALSPSSERVKAPRYQMIPTETDLNALPVLSGIPEKKIPAFTTESRTRGDAASQSGPIVSSLRRKGEALAVSGLVKFGDDIDVIAPADVLKQIFKIPYSKNRVSIAVQRVGQTIILNTGPDIEEGEKLIRRQNRQAKCVDESLFLNFAMHSVRVEACDCPPSHKTSSNEQYKSSSQPDRYVQSDGPLESEDQLKQGHASYRHSGDISQGGDYVSRQQSPRCEKGNSSWRKKNNKSSKSHKAVKKVSEVEEKSVYPVHESEKYRRVGDDGFLRVLFWQFHNFRMLLGSDLLIFSNEKYVAVSLHLWDVSQKVTPLTWLEAWLDNFIASVPELAVCYHQDGVVQGYELLKTDDIFLLKGVSDDGTPAFHPHVVQQNGLSVMRFLQENCKQEPGAYWLYKSAGEEVIQLFDLSVIPKNHSADSFHDSSSSLPSMIYRGRSDSILSLGTLMYRVAHRLSVSMSPNNKARCAKFFKKCLACLDESDHLVVRALAHEQFARLLLTYDDEYESTSEGFPVKSEVVIADAEEESYEFISGLSPSSVQDIIYPPIMAVEQPESSDLSEEENSVNVSPSHIVSSPRASLVSNSTAADENQASSAHRECMVSDLPETGDPVVQTASDPLASKLAAISHVSQAIKSLRWTRQLQSTRPELNRESEIEDVLPPPMYSPVCACEDPDCIEVCDIREWLPTSKIDDKLWKLVLLLGESYLSLSQAYKDSGQPYQTLKFVELACLLYGSVPQDSGFISSMVSSSLTRVEINKPIDDDQLSFDDLPSKHLFWTNAWTLVGDVFVDFYLVKGKEVSEHDGTQGCIKGLKMSSEVLKEVERLKKKMGQNKQNCSSCSLMNCSCQSDRASSGSSASSSVGSGYSRKQNKKSYSRNRPYSRATHFIDNDPDKDHYSTSGFRSVKHQTSDAMKKNGSADEDNSKSGENSFSEPTSKENPPAKSGGIFKYLRASTSGDTDYILSVALSCYEEARKAVSRLPGCSPELQSAVKKKGWVCNELGRNRVERKDLGKAESAFVEAIQAFRQVEDHTNIILINCNLGHGRRALAEDMASKIGCLKGHAIFQNAYLQALETSKLQYSEALRYYAAAKTELSALAEKELVPDSLKNEVNTQFAHTYLKLGMLLAAENTVAKVYGHSSNLTQVQLDQQKHEISANEAIREALSLYESLGDWRKQEAAYAYYQLGCYQRDGCLRFLEKNNVPKGENIVLQKVKQYSSLAERNWLKSMDFYGPKTHPGMFLTILTDRAILLSSLSTYFSSNVLLESALSCLLEGRDVCESKSINPEICAKFWIQLQRVLKNMLGTAKSHKCPQQASLTKSGDAKKLSELYRMSLKSSDFDQLHIMHTLWRS